MVNLFYETIEEVTFTNIVKSLKQKYPRIEEVVDDLNWACQKDPHLGTVIDQDTTTGLEARVIHTTGIGKTPSFWVLIEIDNQKETVTFISLYPLAENQND